jgi:tetratricopeptide (TPR) repeat protein
MNRKDRRAAGKQGKSFGPASGGGPSFSAGAAVSPAAHLFAAAVRALGAGQRAEAERHCRDLLRLDPNHADALHLLGILACQAGQHEAGAEHLRRALTLDPRNPDCHFNLAFALRALGRLDDAAAHFGEAAALRPSYTAAFLAHGDVHVQQGRLGEAATRYQRALRLDPRSVEALYGLANVALQQGRFDDAANRYRRVLALRPDFAEACSYLGVAFAGLGRHDEAIAQYRRALALKPSLIDVYRNLGRLLLARGEVAEALALATNALAIAETDDALAFFATCAQHLTNPLPSPELSKLVARALDEGWSRPGELSALAASLINASPTSAALAGIAADAPPLPAEALAQAAGDSLLLAMLTSAPVCDDALEGSLTHIRAALIASAARGDAVRDDVLAFLGALARQCFINEYVFAETPAEVALVHQVQDALTTVPAADSPIPRCRCGWSPSQFTGRCTHLRKRKISRSDRGPGRCAPCSTSSSVSRCASASCARPSQC